MNGNPKASEELKKEIQKVKCNLAEVELVLNLSIQHVADAKVPYKHLKGGVEFVDVIPKNPSGKLLRRVMREMAKERRMGEKSELKAKL